MSPNRIKGNPADSLVSRVLDLAVEIQSIPAPPLGERQRAEFVYQRFQPEKLHDVSMDEEGNVYGRLPGVGERPPLVVSAHLDTVFPSDADLTVRREADRIYGLGIGDNALGVAGLFGLLWALREKWGASAPTPSAGVGPPGDVWLVANVGEEGLGDLRGMRAVVDRFGDQVLAYIVIEGMALGQIYHRGLSVRRYRLGVHTPGGHSWVDHGCPSAVHELAALTVKLTSLPLPQVPRTTLNVGVISGGISVNAIAAEAHLELDLRSEDAQALENLTSQVEALVAATSTGEVRTSLEVIGDRPGGSIPASHPLVRLAVRCLQAQSIQPNLTIGSTDANLPLSRGLPAVCVGLTTGYGAHTVEEYINIEPLGAGLKGLVRLVEGVFEDVKMSK